MRAAILRRAWVAGGAETYLLDLGLCLRRCGYDVHYLSAQGRVPLDVLAVLDRQDESAAFRLIRDDAAAIEGVTRSYDLFINAAAHFPIAGHATNNWLVVFAPGSRGNSLWRKTRRLATASCRRSVDWLPVAPKLEVLDRLRTYPPSTERTAIRSYDRIIGVSTFVSEILSARHRRHCDVIYPAVALEPTDIKKENMVVSIGRFSPWGNAKRHDVLIQAARMLKLTNPGLRVALVGSLPSDPASQRYLRELRSLASGLDTVDFYVDAERRVMVDLLRQAAYYWHAAGYGLDPQSDPDLVEHFGISIVEAMRLGSIPLVVPVAGPAEIVTDGVDGLYWRTPAELAGLTSQLASSERWKHLAAAAMVRSRNFSYGRMQAAVESTLSRPIP